MTFSEFMAENGYKTQTTFWEDFSIADRFGMAAIQDTYNRAFDEWKDNITYLTELVMVLNHKIFAWYKKNQNVASLYNNLWEQADQWAIENLKGSDLEYYERALD